MDPTYPHGHRPEQPQPPPIGFEMQNVSPAAPVNLGFDGVNQGEPLPYGTSPYLTNPEPGFNTGGPSYATDDLPQNGDNQQVHYPNGIPPNGTRPNTGTDDKPGGTYIAVHTPGDDFTPIDTDLPATAGPLPLPVPYDDAVVTSEDEALLEEKVQSPQDLRESSEILELDMDLKRKRETMFFRDGERRIDYVLANAENEKPDRILKRNTFENNLIEEGLELEIEDKKDGKSRYVKIHAPWEVLSRVAELIGIKMPIKEYDILTSDMEKFCAQIPNPLELGDIVPEEADYFTADFNRDRERMGAFIIKDKATFFSPSQRSLIVNELLMRTRYADAKDKIGVDRLVSAGCYTAAYPLHEGRYTSEHSILTHGPTNDRHLLYETWARPGRWHFYQPLDLIRRYFGEKVGIYFTWLGFYTSMLIPASIVGVVVFLYGLCTLAENAPSNEICDVSGVGNFTMCPQCDAQCRYWKLVSSCTYARLTYLFDNPGTVFFACFMAIWSTMFLEFWKRKQAEIQYDWDVAGFELEEHVRPEFEAKTKTVKLNPITQLWEPFLPVYSKIPRLCTSFVVVLFMILTVLAAVFGVIMYRIIILTLLHTSQDDLIRENAKITTTISAAFINLVLIMFLNRMYLVIAVWLTELERPRTDTEYEDSFTFKMFLFQFINFYSSIVYIAFFKGSFSGHPGLRFRIIDTAQEECDPAGCLIELCIQLGIVMVGKQTFNNFQELMLPKIMNWFRSHGAKKNETEDNLYTRWEQDKDLQAVPLLGLFGEYLEMVIQYGFVTIFVAAFPLAPLFALINNIIEIRLDAYKFVTQWRRPVSFRAQDIGIWLNILNSITFLAVLSNAFIIGWTSEFIPKLVYFYTDGNYSLKGYVKHSLSVFDVNDFEERSKPLYNMSAIYGTVNFCWYSDYRYPPTHPRKYQFTREYWHIFCARLAFVIVFEHSVFFLSRLVSYLIPDIPARVRQLQLRELYLAKEARYETAFSNVHEDKKARKDDENLIRLRRQASEPALDAE